MAARAFLKSFFKSGEAVEKYYKFGAKLGSGSFATVVVAKSRETREKVAIKIIHKSGKTNVKLMEQEVEVLNNVHHPNCVSVREIFETDKALYLVMDLCTGGELLAAISRKERFSEAQASAVVKDILQGLQYLHEKGIVHRDLKPENVLLESRDADSRVKISDFGLSKLVQGKRQFLFSRCGTPAYVAPEVILAKPYDSKVDLWAVGVITFLIIAGHPPFYGETLDQLFDVIVRAEFSFYEKYWGHISGPCMHFVEQLLELDPAKRYSAEQALAHPWITGVMPKAPTLRSMAGLQAYSLARSRGVTAGGDPDSDSSASSSSSSSSSPSPSAAGSGAIDDSISVVSLSEFGDLPRADPWKYFEEAIGETRVAAGVSLVSSAAVAAAEGAAGRPCAAIFQFQELRDVSKVSEKYSLWPSFILAFRNGRLTGTYDNTLILNEMARPSIQKTRAYELGFIRPFLLLVSLSPYSRLWVAETLGVPLTSYIWYGNPHMEAIELLTAKKGIIARSSRFSDSAFSDFLGKVNWHDTLFRVCERVFTHRSDSDDLKEKMSDYRAFNERVGRSAIQDSCMDPTKAEVIEELESSFTIELVMKMFRFREASGVGMAAPRVFSDLEAVASASPAARRMLENFEVAGFDLTRDSTAVLMFINFYFSQRWMVDADQGSFALFWKRETSKTPLSRLSKTIGYAKLLPAAFTITFQRAILGSIGVPLAPFYPEKRSTL